METGTARRRIDRHMTPARLDSGRHDFADVAVVWTTSILCCRIASDGERYRVYVARDEDVLKIREYFDPAEALVMGRLWRIEK